MLELPPRLKVLYPFEGNKFHSSGGDLNYTDVGQGDPVVMLHGNPTWSFFYRDLILGMQESCRCLALDHLGCGLSEKPQQAKYNLNGHIERAAEWIDDLKLEAFHLVVHDWGGAIGFGMASRFPQKIKGITILNTAAYTFPRIPLRISACRAPAIGSLLVRGANSFVRGATTMTTVKPLSPAVKEGYCYPYRNWNDRIAIHRFVQDIPMRSGHPSWQTLLNIESSLDQWKKVPVQIIWGMRDWCFNHLFLERWMEFLPHGEVHRLEDAGHYLFEDAADTAIPLISEFNSRI